MAAQVFDLTELNDFARSMQRSAQQFQRKQKSFLRREGTKLKTKTKREAGKLGRKTGNYLQSIKRGKVYEYNGAQAVRVYSTAPHAHLIEEGHRMVTRGGREVGFVPGHHVFEKAGTAFASEYEADVENFLDELVDSL